MKLCVELLGSTDQQRRGKLWQYPSQDQQHAKLADESDCDRRKQLSGGHRHRVSLKRLTLLYDSV